MNIKGISSKFDSLVGELDSALSDESVLSFPKVIKKILEDFNDLALEIEELVKEEKDETR